jgi:hypothetical protein
MGTTISASKPMSAQTMSAQTMTLMNRRYIARPGLTPEGERCPQTVALE